MAGNKKYPITGKSRKEPDPIVTIRKQAREDFTGAIQDHGGNCYATATKRVESRVFRRGRPDGKRDEWDTEDQQRISVGEKAAERRIRQYGAQGNEEILEQAGNGAADANRDMNEKGVQSVWNWFFKPNNYWDNRYDHPEEPTKPEPEIRLEEVASSSPEPSAEVEDELENTSLLQDLGGLAKWLIGM